MKFPASELLIEVSEEKLDRQPTARIERLDPFTFIYQQTYFNAEIAAELATREMVPVLEEARSIRLSSLDEPQSSRSNKQTESANQEESNLNQIVSDIMKDIPEAIPWLDTRLYHRFSPKSRFWLSIEEAFIPQTKQPVCLLYYLVSAEGKPIKTPPTMGLCLDLLTLDCEVSRQKFSANKKVFQFDKLSDQSLLAIEVREVHFAEERPAAAASKKSSGVYLNTLGVSFISLLDADYHFSNGCFQLPIVFAPAPKYPDICSRITENDSAPTVISRVYQELKEAGRLVPASSIIIKLFEDCFSVD